jgi:ligand-binding sensor domain-containing protein
VFYIACLFHVEPSENSRKQQIKTTEADIPAFPKSDNARLDNVKEFFGQVCITYLSDLMHRYRLLVVCAFLLYAWFPLPAQTQKWTEYASASSVRAIAVEGRYLWLATQTEGLVKFDTQTLIGTQYTAINSQLPTLQYISSIAVDKNRVKWIATPRGLVRYDDTNWNLYNTSNTPLTSSNILTVATGADNSIWVSTLNEIACFSNGGWKLYTPKDFSCLKNITSLHVSPNGDVWLGRYYAQQPCRSAYVLRNGELLPVSDDFNNREVTDITGSASTLWFATNARQIVGGTTRYVSALISRTETEFKTYLWNDIGFTEPTTFTSVAVDKAAGVWVLAPDGESAGAVHFDGKTWTMFNNTNSPLRQSMILNSLATDETGTLWVATNQGLLRYDGAQWREIPRLGLANPPLHQISTFAVDAQRNML